MEISPWEAQLIKLAVRQTNSPARQSGGGRGLKRQGYASERLGAGSKGDAQQAKGEAKDAVKKLIDRA
jgi:hypothetical protein